MCTHVIWTHVLHHSRTPYQHVPKRTKPPMDAIVFVTCGHSHCIALHCVAWRRFGFDSRPSVSYERNDHSILTHIWSLSVVVQMKSAALLCRNRADSIVIPHGDPFLSQPIKTFDRTPCQAPQGMQRSTCQSDLCCRHCQPHRRHRERIRCRSTRRCP